MSIGPYAYPRAIWRVTLDGRDVSAGMASRLDSLSITECRGGEADQLDIVLHDNDGLLEIPRLGVTLRVFLGWEQTGLVDKGTFVVDEVEYSGPPDQITLRARSANLAAALRTRTERSFHGKTINDIVSTVAKAHGLDPVVGQSFGNVVVPHIDQTNESDVAFLNRIGKRYDAVATVKEGRLLFLSIDKGKTASGADMPTVVLSRADGDGFRFHVADRDAYTGVRAYWQDKAGGTRRNVVVGVIGNAKRMRSVFGSEQDALDNARAEWQRIQRGTATLQFDLAYGRPELVPQAKIQFPAMKAPMGGITWLVSRIVHKLDENGLTSSLEAETVEAVALQQEADDAAALDGEATDG
ncbi:contractile injection system protein, VgrG/Pvc8 family [Bordetella genomosp. 9]|nr:contractile injection system protein, VgrG/Pvc8 family [Bordetella genomosp. 9]